MRSIWSRYVRDPFLKALTEVSWLGPVVSAVLIALLVNIISEALIAWGGLVAGVGAVIAMSVAAVVFAYGYSVADIRRRRPGLGPIAHLENPDKHEGLIFLFSREQTLREAIEYHRDALRHCWLLVTPQMQDQAQQAIHNFPGIRFTLHSLSHHYNTQQCYRTVQNIYAEEAPRLEIAPRRVISDITGGTKPMTMGMIVACLDGNRPIEHIPTAYDSLGRPTGPLPPIQIKAQWEGKEQV